jgi:carboxypeptidase C (cathepsin A)
VVPVGLHARTSFDRKSILAIGVPATQAHLYPILILSELGIAPQMPRHRSRLALDGETSQPAQIPCLSTMPELISAAADRASADKSQVTQRDAVDRALQSVPFGSTGTIKLGDRRLDYRVEAAFVPVNSFALDEHRGEAQAAIFTTAYLLDRAPDDVSPRPVCFAFNGGPGSSSIWLHLGALGPKRVRIRDDGTMPRPPYAVEDNPLSWFEHFDLVFVDPPHTGYSITSSDDARKKALSVDGDVDCLAEVVRGWLSRHARWTSPLYIVGESYGTTRGAAIANRLAEHGVALTGLILISCATDIQTISFNPRNDLPYALFLPAFAGVAQYHGCLQGPQAESAAAARARATEFVETDYLRLLHRGSTTTDHERSRAAKRIGELIGLAPQLVEHRNLRITDGVFFTELLRERGQLVGRLEARVSGPMPLSRTHEWDFDPGLEAFMGPYTMAAMGYFTETLGFDRTQRYEVISPQVHKQWNWNRGEAQGNSYCCTSPDLSRALRRNPHLRVLVASGHFDLGTPSTATDWSLAQLDVPVDVRTRITHRYYDAGHMMYTRETDLSQLKVDLVDWLAAG